MTTTFITVLNALSEDAPTFYKKLEIT